MLNQLQLDLIYIYFLLCGSLNCCRTRNRCHFIINIAAQLCFLSDALVSLILVMYMLYIDVSMGWVFITLDIVNVEFGSNGYGSVCGSICISNHVNMIVLDVK